MFWKRMSGVFHNTKTVFVRYPTAGSCDFFKLDWYITMTSWWARWCLKSPASRLFIQPFSFQGQIKESIKAPLRWPLYGEFLAQMTGNAENISIWWRHHSNAIIFLISMKWDLYILIGSWLASVCAGNQNNHFQILLFEIT